MQKLLIAIILPLILTTSCSIFQGKDKKKKFEPAKLENIVQQGEFVKLWSKKFDGGKKSYGYKLVPHIDKNHVYVASLKGIVTKMDIETGDQIWSIDLDMELSAGPGVGSSILVLGTPEGYAVALDKEDGKQLWTVKLSSEILSPPVIDNELAIIRSQDGRVYALDAHDGERKWLFDTNIPNLTLRGNSTPVVKAGRIYIGFDNGKVAAIKQESGDVIWLQNVVDSNGKTELARIVDIDGDMALVATDLYLSSAVGKTMAVATESGRIMWSKDYGSSAGVTASRTKLFIIDSDSNVRALKRTDGGEEWKTTSFKNRLLTKPVFYLGDIVVGDLEGYIHVLDGDSGNIIARTRVGKSGFYTQPVVSGSVLIAYNKDGDLSAFEFSR